MAQQSQRSVDYLRALKQSVSPAAAAAPAREAAVPEQEASATRSDSAERFQGAEKWRSQRFKCEGSAELREEGSDVRTWATFKDVTLHRCYVEAQATYPAGTVLHMKLEANGFRVET